MRYPLFLLILPLLTPALFASATARGQDAQSSTTPATGDAPPVRYLAAIEEELDALSIPHSCEVTSEIRSRCTFTYRGRTSGRDFEVRLIYSDDTDTIYLYVPGLTTGLPDASTTPALLRRLMELNWRLLVAKLEWNAVDGEVRLSTVQNTDSNFDRRAFRNLVRRLGPLADGYARELERITETD
ncbi:MAG: hypothetical protein JRH11_18355 [Deltaproteobacteria bacterium]|nr:hypothetical protein [Deltaproteobacteria bacterium]